MVTYHDVEQAAARIAPHIHHTPLMTSRTFDALTGIRTVFKCENFQRGGAFKLRGAANFVLSIPDADIGKGVVAFSSGNHAQAIAIAGGIRHTKVTVVMPDDAPAAKVAGTLGYGAEVIRYDR